MCFLRAEPLGILVSVMHATSGLYSSSMASRSCAAVRCVCMFQLSRVRVVCLWYVGISESVMVVFLVSLFVIFGLFNQVLS